jgi:kynurenine formamidase
MSQVDELAALMRNMRMVELAPRLERGISRWPTHPHLVIDPTMTHAHDGYYCQSLALPEHVGCHCDVPAHVSPEMMDDTVERLPADRLLALAVVYDF